MIRITKKPAKHPDVLYGQGDRIGTCKLAGETADLIKLFATNPERFDGTGKPAFPVDAKIYGHPDLKKALKTAQNGKCCFCEAKIPHICPGDVEHFRPKRAYLQGDGYETQKPGYYWLSYDWDNLLFCCEQCNRRDKANLFPLQDDATRAKSPDADLNAETPLFIHPVDEDPAQFITFHEEVAAPINADDQRAKWTIETLQLNEDTPDGKLDRRKEFLAKLKSIHQLASLPLDHPDIPNEPVLTARQQMLDALESTKQYTNMARANFAHRITWQPTTSRLASPET